MITFPLGRPARGPTVITEIVTFLRARDIACWRVNLTGLHIQGFMPGENGRAFGIEVRGPGYMPPLEEHPFNWAKVYGQSNAVHIIATSVHDVRLALEREAARAGPRKNPAMGRFQPERVAVAPS